MQEEKDTGNGEREAGSSAKPNMAARSPRSQVGKRGKRSTKNALTSSELLEIAQQGIRDLSQKGVIVRLGNHQDGQTAIVLLSGVRYCSHCNSLRFQEDMVLENKCKSCSSKV